MAMMYGERKLDSYMIEGTNEIVQRGDCVLMRPSDKHPYVALVVKLEVDDRKFGKVWVKRYCRPEEAVGGRRGFHGEKELFYSGRYDMQSVHTIERKCVVHSLKSYRKLASVGTQDYFCRFQYNAATNEFSPNRVAVYCKCEMPLNPDVFMIQCEGIDCKDWFHPSCIGMSNDDAKKLNTFLCSNCATAN